jgi:hypothetical protein
MALCLVFIRLLFHIFSDFQLFRPEHHWRDLSSRNAHLVHQNWWRIYFTLHHINRHLTSMLASSCINKLRNPLFCVCLYFFDIDWPLEPINSHTFSNYPLWNM